MKLDWGGNAFITLEGSLASGMDVESSDADFTVHTSANISRQV